MNVDSIIVRKAVLNDVVGIAEVARTSFPHDFDFGKGFSDKECRYMFKRAIEDKNELVCIALKGEKVVGFAYYINKPPTNGTIILEMIGVRKDLQEKGIGLKLITEGDKEAVRYFRDECEVANLATIHLTASADNPVGQRLYLDAGYEHVGDIPGMVGTGNNELVMLKKVGNVDYRKNLWNKERS